MWTDFIISRQRWGQTAMSCLVLLSTTMNTASALDTGKHTINLHEAIAKTIKHNLELQAFDYQLKAQEGRVVQAGLAPGTELKFELEDVSGSGDYKNMDSAQTTISIGWVLERGVRQRYIDAARAGSDLVFVEADIKRLDAAAETARRYLVSLAYQARRINADKTMQLAEEAIEAVQKRVKAGKTPVAELSRAQAELARRKLEIKNIEYELDSANRRLAAQWGETTAAFEQVEGDITTIPRVESFETLKSQLQQNPEFTRILSDQLLKKAELQLALAQSRPSWHVTAGVRHINSANEQSLTTGITIPFGERTHNPGRIAEARANLAKTDIEQNATHIHIETSLYVIYKKLQYSLHVINVVRDEILPPLEQALTDTRRAYNLGRYSYLEWRSVQAEVLDAQNALIEAGIDAHRNIIEIERLTGARLTQGNL